MSILNVGTVQASTISSSTGTAAITIDSSGRVVHPNIVTWQARLNTTQSAPTTLIWQLEDWDTSGGYNSANGRFTAPVAGYYFVHMNLLPNNPSAADTRLAFQKNGVTIVGQNYIITKNANTWNTFQGTCIVQMNVNDYVSIAWASGDPCHNDGSFASFKGFLIG